MPGELPPPGGDRLGRGPARPYKHAPLAVRERVVFHVERLRDALGEIRSGLASEAAILSTCNRTELYLAAEHPPVAVANWLASTTALTRPSSSATSTRCRASRRCATPSASPRASTRWCWANPRSWAR